MTGPIITSPSNPFVKELAALGERRNRTRTGRFVIEGRREVERALGAGCAVDVIVVCQELAGPDPFQAPPETPVQRLGVRAFAKISRRQNPDGVAARALIPDLTLDASGLGPGSVVLVAEGIEKPGNLGAMLRTARVLGADAVVLASPVTDAFNPNAIRASQGAIFTTRLHAGSTSDVIDWLRGAGLEILAGSPGGGRPPWETDMTSGIAIVVGAEATGLTPAWEKVATPVTIPTTGDPAADSLNAATAAALLLYEQRRQRLTTS